MRGERGGKEGRGGRGEGTGRGERGKGDHVWPSLERWVLTPMLKAILNYLHFTDDFPGAPVTSLPTGWLMVRFEIGFDSMQKGFEHDKQLSKSRQPFNWTFWGQSCASHLAAGPFVSDARTPLRDQTPHCGEVGEIPSQSLIHPNDS